MTFMYGIAPNNLIFLLKLLAVVFAVLGMVAELWILYGRGHLSRTRHCPKGHPLVKVDKDINYCPDCSTVPFKGQRPGRDSDWVI